MTEDATGNHRMLLKRQITVTRS